MPCESAQTQEAIKVLKTTKGDHDVIEIATKYVPSSQETERRVQSSASEDIVVDMRYQDARKTDSATSELNIVHAAPQSFETVLVEPDDVTTEVVVDADGTKRIIVRKLRRTTVTSRQTTQQRVSTLSTALGDEPPTMRAFSEAAMRDQQVTVTRTRPDGTVETTTRQIYGGRVTTGAPTEVINVEEYESEPRYTRIVTQGQLGDISCQPVEEEILMEGGEYQTRTSSVHAVVQQVTKRVIKRTRRIIRKVTIVDGKETTSEEVIEEPEEVEIDEQDIPQISINVIKSEDQKTLIPGERSIESETEEREKMKPEAPIETRIPGSPLQGPFFGPFAKEMSRDKTEKKTTEAPITAVAKDVDVMQVETLDSEDREKENTALEEPAAELAASEIKTDSREMELAEPAKTATRGTQADASVSPLRDNMASKETSATDRRERLPTEVNGTGTPALGSQALIDAERSTVLQTPVEDASVTATAQPEPLKSPSDPAVTEDEPVVTKATCKSDDDAPVMSETLSIELENGTVEVETHHGSSTVEPGKSVDTLSVVVLEKEPEKEDKPEILTKDASSIEMKEKDVTLPKKSEPQEGIIVSPITSDVVRPDQVAETTVSKSKETPSKEASSDGRREEDDSKDEALKPEYKPAFQTVEISLSVRKEDEETRPSVSITTQAERPEVAPYRIVKEDVDIVLPADKETTEVIHDKIVQTAAFLTAEKETETQEQQQQQQADTAEKAVDVRTGSSERSKSDTTSYKSRKKKRHKDRSSTEKPADTESSTSIATSAVESMEIDIPSSDSSKRVSEQPQPDVAEIMKTIESSLSLDDVIMTEDNGYQADDKTMDELSIAPADEDGAKKKRKKKKKQRVRSTRDEDVTQIPKTSSDDAAFTEDSLPLELTKLDKMIEEDKAKEEDEKDGARVQEEGRKVELDDANVQTVVETREASTALTPKADVANLSMFVQTSPEPVPLTLEEEIQTGRTEETHIETQTILEPGLDFSAQTIAEETPEVEDSGVQTATPTATPMEEFAVQTSPTEDAAPAVVATETEDFEAQTTNINVLSTEMQTSPVEVAPMMATETQTAVNIMMEVEQQTTPSPAEEKIVMQETAIQTSPEVPQSFEKIMQTSAPASPEQPDVSHMDTQTIASPEISAEMVETQTTPEESPRKVDLQETEMQTRSPEPTIETTMQTSPVAISPEPAQVREDSVQTSIEAKQTNEEESQTSSPEKAQTFDSSVQIKTQELIPCVEESVQNIPETCEISAQTSPAEEKRAAERTSVSQQTARIPTHTVEVSTEDVKVETVERAETPTPAKLPATSEEAKTKEEIMPTKLLETPEAPDVQVPETASLDEVKQMEVATAIPENVEKVFVERETRDRFPEMSAIGDSAKPEIGVKLKESAASSMSEKDTTSDTSLEIHVQATIELSASDTLTDSVASGGKGTPDTSQDTTATEDLNHDAGRAAERDGKTTKRQKRKRKHKTKEISLPSNGKRETVLGQSVKSEIAIESTKHLEESVQRTPNAAATSKTVPESTSDQFASKWSPDIPETTTAPEARMPLALGKSTVEPLLMPDQQKLSDIAARQSSPEPMDTTEEPLTPVEIEQPALTGETAKPLRAEIRTYVEVISEESREKPATATAPGAGDRHEKKESQLWKEPAAKVPSSPHSSTAAFLLKESSEYGLKPQHQQATQTAQATRIITDRVKCLQNTNESSHLGNILHIAHLEEVTTERLAEERSCDVRRELAQLRNAIQENDAVIVEETLVTVVETISTWLETIEYRVFLNRQCPTGPSHEDARTFVELKDEVMHVEDSIRELDDIWKQVEPSYPQEERERVRECVDALGHQVKVIGHVAADGERHASKQVAKWDEFMNGVNNMYR